MRQAFPFCGTNRSRGVVTLINKLHLQFKRLNKVSKGAERFLLLLAEIQGQNVLPVNVYAQSEPTFFGKLESKLKDLGSYLVIIQPTFR